MAIAFVTVHKNLLQPMSTVVWVKKKAIALFRYTKTGLKILKIGINGSNRKMVGIDAAIATLDPSKFSV
jgi:hypothetical protein